MVQSRVQSPAFALQASHLVCVDIVLEIEVLHLVSQGRDDQDVLQLEDVSLLLHGNDSAYKPFP